MSTPGDPAETGATVSPWRGAGPELVIAGVVIVVAAAAGYLLAGWAGLSVAVTAGAAAAMVVLRYLLPTPTPDAARKAREKPQARLLSGYSHRRFVVHSSIASRGFYQASCGRCSSTCWPPGWPNATACTSTRTRTRPGGCSAAVPATPTCGRGSSRSPGDPEAPEGTQPETRASKASTEPRHPEAHPGAPHRPIGETVMSTVETAGTCTAILDELERAVVGRRRTLELVLIGILAGGHVLLEDLPGLGKTLIARSFARVLGLEFARIQFTPDLLPSDVTGAPLYDQRSAEMVFRPGPVFTQLLLADEINRTPPKTQAALLEAMAEGQVSVDGQSRKLPAPFVVLATDNPIEYEGTYELPEAQLDRFLMRLRLGYLSTGDETAMLRRRVDRAREDVELGAVTSAEGVLAMRDSLEQVEITPDLLDYIVAIVGATRRDPQVQVGASPRGGLALVQLARGQALLSSRDYVVPDDIKQVAVPALAHRLTLRPELWVRQVSSDDVMAKLLSSVPTPRTDPARAQATAVTG